MSYYTAFGKRRSLRLRGPEAEKMEAQEKKARMVGFVDRVKPLLQAFEAQTSSEGRYHATTRFLEALYADPDTPWVLTHFPHFREVTVGKCREFLATSTCGPALRMLIQAMQARFGLSL